MPRLYFGEAIKLMLKTLPCVAVNFGAHALFGLLVVAYYGIILGLYTLFAESLPLVGLLILFGGIGTSGWFYHLAKHYFLYVLKSGHIAVMAEIVDKGALPQGVSQLEWGKEQVKKRFMEVSAMSAIDVLLRGVVRGATQMMEGAVNIIPLPNIEKLSRTVSVVLRQASDYVDEAILARVFLKPEGNVFEEAKDGVILYVMSWRPILANAAGLALFSWASFVIFILLWSPLGILISKLAPSLSFWSSLSVIALAYVSKVSLGDSFAVATTIVAFQKETKGLQPDAAIERQLHAANEKFRELSQKAGEAFRRRTAPATSSPSDASVNATVTTSPVVPPPIPPAVPVAVVPPPIPVMESLANQPTP